MKTNRTTFAFSNKEKEMLDKMCEVMGCNASELFRSFIRDRYLKLFPPYRTDKLKGEGEEELTPEQQCEKMGGVVGVREGIPVCIVKVSENITRMVPIGRLDLLE